MKEQLSQKLQKLKEDFEKGQQTVSQASARLQQDQQTLLRMAGAIQALEELTKEITD